MDFKDKFYWRWRYTAMFLINLPFVPIHVIYELGWGMGTMLAKCFTTCGEEEVIPFWKWHWKLWEDL